MPLEAASYRSTVVDDSDHQRAICAPIARFLSQLRALLLRRRDVPEKRLETKLSCELAAGRVQDVEDRMPAVIAGAGDYFDDDLAEGVVAGAL